MAVQQRLPLISPARTPTLEPRTEQCVGFFEAKKEVHEVSVRLLSLNPLPDFADLSQIHQNSTRYWCTFTKRYHFIHTYFQPQNPDSQSFLIEPFTPSTLPIHIARNTRFELRILCKCY